MEGNFICPQSYLMLFSYSYIISYLVNSGNYRSILCHFVFSSVSYKVGTCIYNLILKLHICF